MDDKGWDSESFIPCVFILMHIYWEVLWKAWAIVKISHMLPCVQGTHTPTMYDQASTPKIGGDKLAKFIASSNK